MRFAPDDGRGGNAHRIAGSVTHLSINLRRYICAAAALLLISACGQKGPLYLPDKNGKTPVTAAPDVSGPAQKIDPEKKDDSQKPPSP